MVNRAVPVEQKPNEGSGAGSGHSVSLFAAGLKWQCNSVLFTLQKDFSFLFFKKMLNINMALFYCVRKYD